MGVHGLWELLLPVGRRVDSAHVSRKTVAVDVSIWLTQFVRAMREADGTMVRNAHLLGVLRRCCKLLYLGVRPVFVFDGGTPGLKRRTLMLRAASRDNQAAKLRRLAEKLLMNRLKLDIVSGRGKGGRGRKAEAGGAAKAPRPRPPPASLDDRARAMDRFIDGAVHAAGDASAEAKRDGATSGLAAFDDDADVFVVDEGEEDDREDDFGAVALPDDIRELDDDALLHLPPALQSSVFRQIKVQQRMRHREEVLRMQSDPASFSRAQIKGFMSSTTLNKRIAAVRSAINERSGASRRIASDSAREYVIEEGADADRPRARPSAAPVDVDDDNDDDDDDDNDDDDDEESGGVAGGDKDGEEEEEEEEEEEDVLRRVRREQNDGRFALKPEPLSGGRVPRSATPETAGVAWATRVLSNGAENKLGTAAATPRVGHHVLGGGRGGPGAGGPRLSAAARLLRLQTGFREDDKGGMVGEEEWESGNVSELVQSGQHGGAAGEKRGGDADAVSDDDDVEWEDRDVHGVCGVGAFEEQEAAVVTAAAAAGALARRGNEEEARLRAKPVVRGAAREAGAGGGRQSLAQVQSAGLAVFSDVFGAAAAALLPSSSACKPDGVAKMAEAGAGTGGQSLAAVQCAGLEAFADVFAAPRARNPGEEVVLSDVKPPVRRQEDASETRRAAVLPRPTPERTGGGRGRMASPSGGDASAGPVRRKGDDLENRDLQAAIQASMSESLRTGDAQGKFAAAGHSAGEARPGQQLLAVTHGPVSEAGLTGEYRQGGALEDPPLLEALRASAAQEQATLSKDVVVDGGDDDDDDDDGDGDDCGDGGTGDIVRGLPPEKAAAAAERLVVEASALESQDVAEVNQWTDADLARLQEELGAQNVSLERRTRDLRGATEALTDEMYGETRDLLRLLGIPYLEAPMEAEAQCAYLNKNGLVDAVLTEDSDAFLFGAKVVYRHLFADGKFAESYDAACVKSELGIDRDRFIKLALLLGSDYSPGVRGVGIVNSMEVLQAFPGDDGLRQFKEWSRLVSLADKEPPGGEADSMATSAVRRRFCWKHRNMKRNWEIHDSFPSQLVIDAYMRPDVDESKQPFTWNAVDAPGLAKFCLDKFAWGADKFDDAIGPVLKQMVAFRTGAPSQTVIEDFFKPHRFAKIRSERLHAAVKGIAGGNVTPLLAPPRGKAKRKSTAPDGAGEPAVDARGAKKRRRQALATSGGGGGRAGYRNGRLSSDAVVGGAVEEVGREEGASDDPAAAS
jgi:5'-3' exonuclease